MIPELGHFSLILALALAGLLATIPLFGVHLQRDVWMRSAGSLAAGLFTFLLLSFVCLSWRTPISELVLLLFAPLFRHCHVTLTIC